jgi:hypothetical protein
MLGHEAHGAAPRRECVQALDEAHADHRADGIAGSAGPAHELQRLDQPADFGGVEYLGEPIDRLRRWYLRNVHGSTIPVVLVPGGCSLAGTAFFLLFPGKLIIRVGRKDAGNAGEKRQLSRFTATLFAAILQVRRAGLEPARLKATRMTAGRVYQFRHRRVIGGGRRCSSQGAPTVSVCSKRRGAVTGEWVYEGGARVIGASAPEGASSGSSARLLLYLPGRSHECHESHRLRIESKNGADGGKPSLRKMDRQVAG